MSSSEQRARLLLRCQERPRTLHQLTQGDYAEHSKTIERTAKEQEAAGNLEFIEGEGYMTTEAGLAEIAQPVNLAPPKTYGPMSTIGSYVSEISKVPARGEAAMRAYGLPSLGFGA